MYLQGSANLKFHVASTYASTSYFPTLATKLRLRVGHSDPISNVFGRLDNRQSKVAVSYSYEPRCAEVLDTLKPETHMRCCKCLSWVYISFTSRQGQIPSSAVSRHQRMFVIRTCFPLHTHASVSQCCTCHVPTVQRYAGTVNWLSASDSCETSSCMNQQ